MTQKQTPVLGVLMDVMINGYFDNGSSTLRSHVSQHRLVWQDDRSLWVAQYDDYWSRDAEIFASDHVEQDLTCATMKALTRYCEAMRLGDFQP